MTFAKYYNDSRMYQAEIIPLLVACGDLTSIQAVAAELSLPHTDILRDNIPCIVTHILPVFASGKKTSKASASYNLLVKELTQEVLTHVLCLNL